MEAEQKQAVEEPAAVEETESTEVAPDSGADNETESTAVAKATIEERLAAAEMQASEYLEGWQRARAEFANARKRMQRESAEVYRNATIDVIARLLPAIDDYDRAMASVSAAIAEDSWFEGIQLVHRKLHGILESAKIEPINAVGEHFDPNIHNAIMKEASETHESGIVIRELQPGYRLGERVIRPSLVVVAE